MCGGWAAAGTGTREDEPDMSLLGNDARSNRLWWEKQIPTDADRWPRDCHRCATAKNDGQYFSAVLAALIGPEHGVTEADARALVSVLNRVDGMRFLNVTAQSHNTATGTPWAHVSDADRDLVLSAYGKLIASRMRSISAWGACGMCGRNEQVGRWIEGPPSLTWPNGDRVAFCETCAHVWDVRGLPTFIDDLRRVGVEAASGVPISLGMSAPDEFRPFCESRAADPAGLDQPWSWSDKLTEFIESRWIGHPEAAPADRREEFTRRRRASFAAPFEAARREREAREASTW